MSTGACVDCVDCVRGVRERVKTLASVTRQDQCARAPLRTRQVPRVVTHTPPHPTWLLCLGVPKGSAVFAKIDAAVAAAGLLNAALELVVVGVLGNAMRRLGLLDDPGVPGSGTSCLLRTMGLPGTFLTDDSCFLPLLAPPKFSPSMVSPPSFPSSKI